MKKITLCVFALFTFAFICQSGAQTLNQNASWPNAEWTVTGTYNNNPAAFEADPTTSENFAFDDDDAGTSDDDIAAESPVIDLTAAHTAGETWLMITVDYTYRFLSDSLTLEYWDADSASWVTWEQFSGNDDSIDDNFCNGARTTFTSIVLNIVGFTATQQSGFRYRMSYLDDGGAGGGGWRWGFCLDSPTITSSTPPPCPDPSNLIATAIMDTTASLGWTDNGSATMGDIEYGATGFTPTETPTVTNKANPYMATGFTAETTYDFYVRANCGVDGVSNWVGPFTFTTACVAITAPYTEDFETFTTDSSAFTSENCWTGSGGTYFWKSAPGTDVGSGGTGPDPSITTGNYFYTESSSGIPGNMTDLVSRLVDLTALTAPALTFNYHMFGGQIGTLDVIVNGTTTEWTLSGEQQTSATDPWGSAIVDLASYAGQSVTITFRATGAGAYEGDISIDNVSFTELPPVNDECVNAIGLTLGTEITADNTGATDSGVTSTCDSGSIRDLWYSFVAPASEEIIITCSAANYSLFNDCGGTSALSCNTSDITTGLTSGNTYYVRVTDDGTNFAPGSFTLKVEDKSLSTTEFDVASFTYFPNPVKNTLTLNAQKTIENVTMYNMLGQEILRATPNTTDSELDMSNLQYGAYFVKVTIANTTKTIRVIKQ